MKIIQVCPRYSPYIGGVETHVAEISGRLAKNGHDVTVVTTDPSGKLKKAETVDGIKIVRFPAFAPGDAYYISPSIYSYIKRSGKSDVVHAHGYHAFPALFASLSTSSKFLFTPHYHGKGHTMIRDMLLRPYRLLGDRIFKKADTVICVSEYEKSLVCNDFGQYCKKAVVIPNGVNKREFKSLVPNKKDSRVILYVGRLEEYKGIQYVIRALPYLDGHRLVMIGRGPYGETLSGIAKDEGVSDRITHLEGLSREELLRWYATADVFVMLSGHEAYGITVAEALSAGVPCVVAKTSALSEFIDGSSCRGVDLPVEAEHLAAEIKAAKFEGSGAKKIMDWDEVVDKLLNVYAGDRS
ncbi:glycosyltransferase family 1 protein [Methanocella sp. CWC-04]|uniref:Glycosyltransferase family 1 protein n=1 Tax=Methanooceanicella nereidis TaxID=2052831 RepID=A0AAP2RAZ0_9EURY|nr:glycosyltransferase family 4 protein [Methanocella sp. CWC-04]MCD1294184.1 glycosyltransferase family 1 protein [Methanocella sp. CWC-04]